MDTPLVRHSVKLSVKIHRVDRQICVSFHCFVLMKYLKVTRLSPAGFTANGLHGLMGRYFHHCMVDATCYLQIFHQYETVNRNADLSV